MLPNLHIKHVEYVMDGFSGTDKHRVRPKIGPIHVLPLQFCQCIIQCYTFGKIVLGEYNHYSNKKMTNSE